MLDYNVKMTAKILERDITQRSDKKLTTISEITKKSSRSSTVDPRDYRITVHRRTSASREFSVTLNKINNNSGFTSKLSIYRNKLKYYIICYYFLPLLRQSKEREGVH